VQLDRTVDRELQEVQAQLDLQEERVRLELLDPLECLV